MKLAYNPTWKVLNVVAIVMSVLQTATLVDADAIKCVAGVWCCEQYVREECKLFLHTLLLLKAFVRARFKRFLS